MKVGGGGRAPCPRGTRRAPESAKTWPMGGFGVGGGEGGSAAAVGRGTRLDRQDLRLQLDEGREVCTAGLAVVLAGAVGAQHCLFLARAVFEQEVHGAPVVCRAGPVGIAVQDTPVEVPVGVALGEVRDPVGPCAHADAGGAVCVASGEDGADNRIGEDAVLAVGGAVVRGPAALDGRH
jgi:hypothetical protein